MPSFQNNAAEGGGRAEAGVLFPGPSGNILIDALLSDQMWDTNSLTFSFPTSASNYASSGYQPGDEQDNNFEAFSVQQQNAVRAILTMYSNVANLSFSEVTETDSTHGTLRYAMSDTPSTAWGYYPWTDSFAGDSWYNNTSGNYDNPVLGDYDWMTIVHETGHALGLKHPFETDVFGALPADWDSMEYSVMTYRSTTSSDLNGYTNEQWGYAQSPMMLDIAALQYMYGANYTYNSSNTVYTWSPTTGQESINGVAQGLPGGNVIFMTVWDGGGVDTYDFSNYADNLTIDLGQGHHSMTNFDQLAELDFFTGQRASGNIYNALEYQNNPQSLIENATGGTGSDIFYGNDANNVMIGGSGIDYFYADLGADTYYGATPTTTDLNNTLSYDLAPTALALDLTAHTLTGAGGFGDGDTWFAVQNFAGTEFNDSMTGDAGANGLGGNGGDDVLTGAAGNDILSGGDGNDLMVGGAGSDTLNGGNGFDTVSYAGSASAVSIDVLNFQAGGDAAGDSVIGDEQIIGTAFNDTLRAGFTAMTLIGAAGNDTLTGSSANDTLAPGVGVDSVDGGAGMDIISYADASGGLVLRLLDLPSRTGEAANDTISNMEGVIGTAQNDDIESTNVAAYMDGGAGDDIIKTFAGNDTIFGGAGNDAIAAGAGADVIDGGSGTDSIDYSASGAGIQINLAGGSGSGGDALGDLLTSVENLIGSGFNDLVQGSDVANVISGGAGVDILFGNDGNDQLSGGDGDDTLLGGAGADVLGGGAGVDTIMYGASSAGVNINLQTGVGSGGDAQGDILASIENVSGTGLDDVLTGKNGFANTLDGSDGNDLIAGGQGADTLIGGNGVDTLDYSNSFNGVDIRLFQNTAAGGDANGDSISGFENIIGSTKTDTLAGDDGVNTISGGAGNETITGRDGGDHLNGDAGNDTLLGGNGDDVLIGGAGNDTLGGGVGNDTADYSASGAAITVSLQTGAGSGGDAQGDTLVSIENMIGSAFADIIAGKNNWDNVLDGGAGADTLSGGTGNDTFVFHANDANGDTVLDFSHTGAGNHDTLEFDGYGTAAQGANLVQIDATHWQINSADGLIHDTITIANAVVLTSGDYIFGGG